MIVYYTGNLQKNDKLGYYIIIHKKGSIVFIEHFSSWEQNNEKQQGADIFTYNIQKIEIMKIFVKKCLHLLFVIKIKTSEYAYVQYYSFKYIIPS